LYVMDELKNYWTDYHENWYIHVFLYGEGLYDMLIDATRHQVALQSSNFGPVQPIVMKISMMMYF